MSEANPANTGCPISDPGVHFRPLDQDGMYEFFADIREETPIFYSEELDYWVVTHRADVFDILRNPDDYSAANALDPICPMPKEAIDHLVKGGFTVEPTQVNCDPPKHTRIRQIAARFLNTKRFSTYEDDIRELARYYIAQMKTKIEGQDNALVDLVEEITYELPARVVMLLLGDQDIDPLKLKSWGDDRLLLTFGRLGDKDAIKAGGELLDYWNYCKDLIAKRLKEPKDDYPSTLLAMRDGDDEKLSVNEATCLIFGIMLAGHETTSNGLGNIIRHLLLEPGAWNELASDLSRLPNAIEECLRMSSPVVAWRRVTNCDVEIAGQQIPKGSKILLSLASANRDPECFEDPEVFDIDRSNARSHLVFGNGTHFCIGAPLARLEIRVVLEELMAAFPDMKLAEDEKTDWVRTLSFRGPKALNVVLK